MRERIFDGVIAILGALVFEFGWRLCGLEQRKGERENTNQVHHQLGTHALFVRLTILVL